MTTVGIGAKLTAYVTPDGMQWLDAEGNQPDVDGNGHLRAPFILATYEADGVTVHRKERWIPPAILPLTPAALRASARPTASDRGADAGNIQGGQMAVDQAETRSVTRPVPKPGKKGARKEPATKTTAKASPAGTASKGVAKKSGNGQVAARSRMNGEEGPSKSSTGLVYIRHMRSPRDAFILIKNPQVFGTESNWAAKDEFKSAGAALEFANKNGMKVVNPPK